MNTLTNEQERIIKQKETEAPFSGEYWNFFRDGIYICRQCGLPLFDAKAKFEAGCGWPSFDESFRYAVKELIDGDATRTEIICARCGGHLGHVFRGEEITAKDTRNCANSLSIKFIPREDADAYVNDSKNMLDPKTIVLGGGCFWCIEAALLRVSGVLSVESGYAGGNVSNPTYEQVCSGETGHAEVVKVTYDEHSLGLEKLLDFFFMIHDPTTKNRQGHDVGTQYRSVIFYKSDTEKARIDKYLAEKQSEYRVPMVTEVVEESKFYGAEEYHQRYFDKNPNGGYCQMVVAPKVNKIATLNNQ